MIVGQVRSFKADKGPNPISDSNCNDAMARKIVS